jgi:YVTN family beta-propeller protein
VYVANEDSHNVTVIDATTLTVTTTISLPAIDAVPRDVDFDTEGNYAYVPSGDIGYGTVNDNVYVIRTSDHTVVKSIELNPYRNPNVVAVAPQMAECKPPPTATPTGSIPVSPTNTPSVTPTHTPTIGFTGTFTYTPTPTDTPTLYPTGIPTSTFTSSFTVTPTPTLFPSKTLTPAPTQTPLPIPDTGGEGLLLVLLGISSLLVFLRR